MPSVTRQIVCPLLPNFWNEPPDFKSIHATLIFAVSSELPPVVGKTSHTPPLPPTWIFVPVRKCTLSEFIPVNITCCASLPVVTVCVDICCNPINQP